MKKIFKLTGAFLLLVWHLNCTAPATKENQKGTEAEQTIDLVIDGNKKLMDSGGMLSSSYTQQHYLLSYMSDKEDIQLTISAYMPELKTGTFQVYNCKSASQCNEQFPDNNQTAQFGPAPKDPMPAASLFRIAYFAPQLGLKPMTLTVSSITEVERAGVPGKTKRIKGKLSGVLACIEQEAGGYDWHIAGKTTQISADFDVYCSVQ